MPAPLTEELVTLIPVDQVIVGPHQPRTEFDDAGLRELAASIREQGLLQPIVVRAVGKRFELIAGERRWRACRLLGLGEIPALVRVFSDEGALEAALVENLQRADLSPVDEARAYQQFVTRFAYTQAQIAQRTGRSRAAVANSLRLLQLPNGVLDMLHAGDLTEGHARALLALPHEEDRLEMAGWVARNAVSVRDTERRIRRLGEPTPGSTAAPAPGGRDLHVQALEDRLRRRFGTKVSVTYRQGRGAVSLEYYDDDDLERLVELLEGGSV